VFKAGFVTPLPTGLDPVAAGQGGGRSVIAF